MAITFYKTLLAIGVPEKTAIRFMNISHNDRTKAPNDLVKIIQIYVAKWEKSNGKIVDLEYPLQDPHEKLIADNLIRIAYEEAKEREIGTLK